MGIGSGMSDLTDEKRALIGPWSGGSLGWTGEAHRRRIVERFVCGADGCSWRPLPHDFPPWQTVFWHFKQWRADPPTGPRRLRDRVRGGRDPMARRRSWMLSR